MKRFFATIRLNIAAESFADARVLVREIEKLVNTRVLRSHDNDEPGLYEAWYDDIEEDE